MGNTSRHTRNDGLRALYADWLRIPQTERMKIATKDKDFPKSKTAWSKKHGVSTVSMWKWEQDPEFRKLVHTRAMGTIMTTEETEKAIAVLKAKAFEGNIQAIKLLLNSVGLLNPEKEPEPELEEEDLNFGSWSEEELAAFLKDEDGDSDTGE